jgi:hypothetical protein
MTRLSSSFSKIEASWKGESRPSHAIGEELIDGSQLGRLAVYADGWLCMMCIILYMMEMFNVPVPVDAFLEFNIQFL